jgi:hypothetical protein
MKLKNIIRGDKHRAAQQDLQELQDIYQQRDNVQYSNIDIAGQVIENGITVLMEAAGNGRLQLVQLLLNGATQTELQNLVTSTNITGMNVLNYANSHLVTFNYIQNLMNNNEIVGGPALQTDFDDLC